MILEGVLKDYGPVVVAVAFTPVLMISASITIEMTKQAIKRHPSMYKGENYNCFVNSEKQKGINYKPIE
jgi:hypothetical protein